MSKQAEAPASEDDKRVLFFDGLQPIAFSAAIFGIIPVTWTSTGRLKTKMQTCLGILGFAVLWSQLEPQGAESIRQTPATRARRWSRASTSGRPWSVWTVGMGRSASAREIDGSLQGCIPLGRAFRWASTLSVSFHPTRSTLLLTLTLCCLSAWSCYVMVQFTRNLTFKFTTIFRQNLQHLKKKTFKNNSIENFQLTKM